MRRVLVHAARALQLSVLAVLPALYASPVALAQTSLSDPRNLDMTDFGRSIQLGPNWLFAAGDNPAWAAPALDDTAWTTVSAQKQLFDYGFHDLRYGWYRLHIHLRPGARGLAIGLKNTNGSYEIFANGVRIGGNGPLPPLDRFNQYGFYAYPIPDSLMTAQGDLVLAVRFGFNAVGLHGIGSSTPLSDAIGAQVLLLSRDSVAREAFFARREGVFPDLILAGLSMLTGLVSLALFLALRRQMDYLAAAAYMLAFSIYDFLWATWEGSDITLEKGLVTAVFFGTIGVALIEFMRRVIGLRRNHWITAFQIVSFLAAFSAPLSSAPWFPYRFGVSFFYVPMMVVDVWLAALLARAWMRGNMEARVLLPALLLITFGDYWAFFNYGIFFFHLVPAYHPLPKFNVAGCEFSLLQIGDFLSFITVLLFLVLRTIGIARDRARATAELEAARSVQQVLVPEELPIVSRFELRSVYHPAGEVGGDFYQVVPTAAAGVLIIIGDVSGKGMPAAMTVSLLVGAFRTLTHYTESPAEILSAMNQRMIGRNSGGFTTCLVVRIDADGSLTAANAGHLPPYLDGAELKLESRLPLGLTPHSDYTEAHLTLSPGSRLTFLTDGVVEAQSPSGELFGFDRTRQISTQSAEAIASAAQAHGQEDDITVLTLAFAPAEVLHA
ncbi:MAG TPA: SpoIIE family protein phosphatase [Terracidiphilus sp.]|nr:SpoIIE family protein phosphatase [Terracidiphilus sp.]